MGKFVKGDVVVLPFPFSDLGKLSQESNIRPNRLFTADSNIILNSAGAISKKKLQEVVDKIVRILNA